MIVLHHVFKSYGQHPAILDASITFNRREVVGLLGENGAGKSTLLNMIAGYDRPDAGDILVDSLPLASRPIEVKRKIGYLPERPPLYLEMTVREYLNFCMDLKEVTSKSKKQHLTDLVRLTTLEDVVDRKISNLSHGYQQRLGIAQALCGDPEILLFDEPTNGLDPTQTFVFMEMINKIRSKHTIIVSSHALSVIQALAQRVVILHHGRIVKDIPVQPLNGSPSNSCSLEKIYSDVIIRGVKNAKCL